MLLHVAFSRWSVERCLQDEKTELGLSHFEVRGDPAIVRHWLITQVSHLFLARETQRLRGENPEVTLPQVHTVINAVIESLPLPPEARHLSLRRTARIVTHWQHRN